MSGSCSTFVYSHRRHCSIARAPEERKKKSWLSHSSQQHSLNNQIRNVKGNAAQSLTNDLPTRPSVHRRKRPSKPLFPKFLSIRFPRRRLQLVGGLTIGHQIFKSCLLYYTDQLQQQSVVRGPVLFILFVLLVLVHQPDRSNGSRNCAKIANLA